MTEGRFERCIRAMNKGDRSGLKEVYEEYLPYIYGIVRGLLASKEDAEDVTSEFFIRLWEKSDTYRPGSGHKGWLATIARNLAVDAIRKKRREEPMDLSEEELLRAAETHTADTQGMEPSVEDQVVENLTMEDALLSLKDTERQIVHMKLMGELTLQEIADIRGEPLGTVAWRYREALKKLRRCGYEESGRSL